MQEITPTNKLLAPDAAHTSGGCAQDIMVATIVPRDGRIGYARETKKYILDESKTWSSHPLEDSSL
jgi:hypothetical protein